MKSKRNITLRAYWKWTDQRPVCSVSKTTVFTSTDTSDIQRSDCAYGYNNDLLQNKGGLVIFFFKFSAKINNCTLLQGCGITWSEGDYLWVTVFGIPQTKKPSRKLPSQMSIGKIWGVSERFRKYFVYIKSVRMLISAFIIGFTSNPTKASSLIQSSCSIWSCQWILSRRMQMVRWNVSNCFPLVNFWSDFLVLNLRRPVFQWL